MRGVTLLSAVTVVAAFGVSGCTTPAGQPAPTSSSPLAEASSVAVPSPVPLPAPEALTAVMDRLADPVVNGGEKLALIQDGAPQDAATLDRFASALRDGGYVPVSFTATDVAWSEVKPGEVLATVKVATSNPGDHGEFAFPLAFRPGPAGWQLTRDTAEMLLAFPPGQ